MPCARVLLFDPEPAILEVLEELLSGEGIQCCTAKSSDDLRALLASACKPAAIVLDIPYPPDTSVELLKRLRADPQLVSVPVIVTTTLPRAAVPPEAYPLVLSKPFDLYLFLEALRLVLKGAVEHAASLVMNAGRPVALLERCLDPKRLRVLLDSVGKCADCATIRANADAEAARTAHQLELAAAGKRGPAADARRLRAAGDRADLAAGRGDLEGSGRQADSGSGRGQGFTGAEGEPGQVDRTRSGATMSTPKQPAPPTSSSSPPPAKQPGPSGAQPPAKKLELFSMKLRGQKIYEPGITSAETDARISQAMKKPTK